MKTLGLNDTTELSGKADFKRDKKVNEKRLALGLMKGFPARQKSVSQLHNRLSDYRNRYAKRPNKHLKTSIQMLEKQIKGIKSVYIPQEPPVMNEFAGKDRYVASPFVVSVDLEGNKVVEPMYN